MAENRPVAFPTAKSQSAYEMNKAVREAASSYDQNKKDTGKKKKKFFFSDVTEAIKGIFMLTLLGLLVLVVDGARREYQEYYANLADYKPEVSVRRAEAKVDAARKMRLENRDYVNTGKGGNATIAFPDGTSVIVDPNTQFEVQMLDYSRGPKRDRSFLVKGGSVFIRISKLFGKSSQGLICTPNAVAAARGTGYAVNYDAANDTTIVECIHGKVAVKTVTGRVEIVKGQVATAVKNAPPSVSTIPGGRQQILLRRFNSLAKLDPPLNPILIFERNTLKALDPALQIVGLTPGGWNWGDTNTARLVATQRALTLLQQALEAEAGDVPDNLNPVTLAELGLSAQEREKILESMAGFTLDSYKKTGQNNYEVRCRSRDSAGTPFIMTPNGAKQAK